MEKTGLEDRLAGRNSFAFKQFNIEQDRCAMKVTSDACLFGASINLENASHILDIGAGTGLLAIMAAQRSEALIDAVEIDEHAAAQARQNISGCPWSDRINVETISIQAFSEKAERKYDIIISNPPFYSRQTKSANPLKRTAWHDENLGLSDLVTAVIRLLKEKGQFHVLLPSEMRGEFSNLCLENRLHIVSETKIKHFPGSDPRRLIVTCSQSKIPVIENELIIYDAEQQYSCAAYELLRPFYLSIKN